MPHIPVLNFLSNKFEITSQGLTTIVNAAPIGCARPNICFKGGLTRTLVGGLTSTHKRY
jgi:hypothetical protein